MSSHLWVGPGPFDVRCGATNPARAFQRADLRLVTCPRCLSDDVRIDLGAPPSAPVDSGATEGLEGPQIFDAVEHPPHYRWLPVEAIEITENFNFCMGNALKYILRADHKGKPEEDIAKAIWYLKRELENRKKNGNTP